MSAVEYDGDATAPRGRSQWFVLAGVAAVALLVLTRGVVTLLVAALLLVVVALVVGVGYSALKAVRGRHQPDPLTTASAGR